MQFMAQNRPSDGEKPPSVEKAVVPEVRARTVSHVAINASPEAVSRFARSPAAIRHLDSHARGRLDSVWSLASGDIRSAGVPGGAAEGLSVLSGVVNRVFRSRAALHEPVVYDWLVLQYKSMSARPDRAAEVAGLSSAM